MRTTALVLITATIALNAHAQTPDVINWCNRHNRDRWQRRDALEPRAKGSRQRNSLRCRLGIFKYAAMLPTGCSTFGMGPAHDTRYSVACRPAPWSTSTVASRAMMGLPALLGARSSGRAFGDGRRLSA
jgi:hypothetical protein